MAKPAVTLVGLAVSLAEPVDMAAPEMADPEMADVAVHLMAPMDVAAHEMEEVAACEMTPVNMDVAAHEHKVVPVEETVVGCRRLVENVGHA